MILIVNYANVTNCKRKKCFEIGMVDFTGSGLRIAEYGLRIADYGLRIVNPCK